jgi:hypothetical protein
VSLVAVELMEDFSTGWQERRRHKMYDRAAWYQSAMMEENS